jgi:hypothetical protein
VLDSIPRKRLGVLPDLQVWGLLRLGRSASILRPISGSARSRTGHIYGGGSSIRPPFSSTKVLDGASWKSKNGGSPCLSCCVRSCWHRHARRSIAAPSATTHALARETMLGL